MVYPGNLFRVMSFFSGFVALIAFSFACTMDSPQVFDLEITKNHPAKTSTFWQASNYKSKAITQKIYNPSKAVLSLLKLKPAIGTVKPVRLSKAQKSLVVHALRELPRTIIDKLNSQLIGIYFVSGLPEYGVTEYVLGPDLQPLAAFVVMDLKLLNMTANEYATKRARSVFEASEEVSIDVMAMEGKDSPKSGLQLGILEELAKVLSIGRQAHPPWDRAAVRPFHPLDFPYSKISWTLDEDGNYAISKEKKRERYADVGVFKYSQQIDMHRAVGIYKMLARHGFSNIAAIQSPSEDFAQAIATFVHTRLLGRPYQVVVSENGKKLYEFSPCWTKPVCASREKYIQEILR